MAGFFSKLKDGLKKTRNSWFDAIFGDYVVMQVGPDKIHLVFARGAISQIEEKGAENTMNESVVE